MSQSRVIVGISGASGAAIGLRVLERLAEAGRIETHLVISKSGQITAAHGLGASISEVMAEADVVYKARDIAAAISSGSFRTMGMLVAPCSIRTLSEIATGVTSSLLTRAADVVLKERRKLVLMVRETPYHLGYLRSMTQVTEMGAVVMPPVPAFYTRPATVDEIVRHSVGRALDLLGVENNMVGRWGEEISVRTTGRSAASGERC